MSTNRGPGLRVHMASSALSKLRIVMWASLALGVIVVLFGGETLRGATGFFFGGVFLVLLVAYKNARAESSHCSFCDRTRAQVKYLVAGPAVAICEECAPLALQITTEPEATGWFTVAESLPKNCPWSVSSAIVDALLVGRDASPEIARTAAVLASRLQNMAAAERALSQIPEAQRTASEWLTLGVVIGKQGRYDEAIAMTGRVEGDERAPWVKNNLAWFSVRKTTGTSYRASGALSRDEAARWLQDLDDARQVLLERKPEGWEDLRHKCLGTRAEIQRVVGDLDAALASIDRAQAEGPLNGEQLLCRARILARRGRRDDALADAKAALAALHPESDDAAEARALTTELLGETNPAPA
jgi:tetratricopeptide (TPR) repeat protein